MIAALFLLQAAAAPPPDIELNIRATARSVEIERKGKAELRVHAGPDGDGGKVEARVTPPANGATRLNNVELNIHAEARIADRQENQDGSETSTPP